MSDVKVAVIYYSATGNTHAMAQAVAEGAREAGAEVRVKMVAETAPQAAIDQNAAWKEFHAEHKDAPRAELEDLESADAIIMGTPSRFGTMASQLKQYIDTTGGLWFHGKLANKIVAGFCTASNAHGGQEATILSLYNTFYHWGAIVAAPGYTDQVLFAAGGNPYGSSATNAPNAEELAGARVMGRRVASIAQQFKRGQG